MKAIVRQRTIPRIALIFLLILNAHWLFAQPGNDNCSGVSTLSTSAICNITTGNLHRATNAAPTGACGGATATTTYDAWFRFQATNVNTTITVSNLGSGLSASTTYLEVLTGAACAGFTSIACQNISTRMSLTGLTVGVFYYVRVYVTSNPTNNPSSRWDFDICIQDPPANDDCAGAVTLTSATTCTNTATTLDLALITTGLPAGCEVAGNYYDTWYKFVASSTSHTVTISSLGANITNPAIQLYSGTCAGLTSIQCATTSLTNTTLTIGNTYFIRVSNVGTNPSGTGGVAGFNICVTHPVPPPANDNCSGAISLSPAVSCSNTTGSLISATSSTGLPAGCEVAGTHYDVWYSFVAGSTYELITLSSIGSGITNPAVQLYSGTCGTLTSIACGTTSIASSGLTVGATYYIRVSNVGSAVSSNGGFSICVYHPNGSSYDFGKSYVNITRNSGGGTINPGDTLEIRATLVIRSQSLDSIAFFDTLRANGGLALVPGSIALRTNEGKVYKSFTDIFDTDAGYYYTNGTDTIIRINIGTGASSVARGRLTNTSKPSVFGGTCIIMATYRVVVYAGYTASVNVGGGVITIRDGVTTMYNNLAFRNRSAVIYNSPGLCPGPVAATNAIGGDYNGTFGAPTTSAPFPRNRGTSSNVLGYIYKPFVTGGGPNDYYYGIANNTSATYTTVNTWPKNDSRRLFNVWDITGDHTGATNLSRGNNPCDTTLPVSPTNPCGYMLVINSAYKTDTAFQYTVTNLCPNTYYEISAWLKNICSKCSCDSNGVGASGAGYIPFAPGDSSGVQPNLAFDINGIDYYTTGNIVHSGSVENRQTGSDSTNIWYKRGFTYVTGVGQTSLTLTIRNNAPGGGGNDWALDDISLATCLPNMNYSPSLAPTVCDSNSIVIYDTVRSYFNNYNYYKWQRSTDDGTTWTDVSPATGPITPVWNGSAWEYITSYVVPSAHTTLADNGDRYRLIVATTSSNLSNSDCQFTDGVSLISLNIIDCGVPLKTELLHFSGKLVNDKANLTWTVSMEDEQLVYQVEKSLDGVNFYTIGVVNALTNGEDRNIYSYIDPAQLNSNAWYRISLNKHNTVKKYSRAIMLNPYQQVFTLMNVINPFTSDINFTVNVTTDSKVEASLLDIYGKLIRKKSFMAYSGSNSLHISNTESLPAGVYLLQIRNKDKIMTRKLIKK